MDSRLIFRLRTRDHIVFCQSALVARSGTKSVQAGCSGVQGSRHGDAPRYLGPLTRVDDLPGRRTLRSTSANRVVVAYHPSNCQQSAAEPLRLRLHTSGIHCQLTSLRQAH